MQEVAAVLDVLEDGLRNLDPRTGGLLLSGALCITCTIYGVLFQLACQGNHPWMCRLRTVCFFASAASGAGCLWHLWACNRSDRRGHASDTTVQDKLVLADRLGAAAAVIAAVITALLIRKVVIVTHDT